MTTLALCMAGLYTRFRDAGYTTPKFLLPLQGRPILAHIVDELAPERVLLVANERDSAHGHAIQAAVPGAFLAFIGDTEGQAQTAMEAARLAIAHGWGGQPIAFHNIDTILHGRDLRRIGQILRQCDGFIDVFDADNPAYSYVRADGSNRVTEIAEKSVISRHATSGLYGFASPELYLACAAATTERTRGEFYISNVYARMLAQGRRIQIDPTPRRIDILGTPAEYEQFIREGL